MMFSPRNQNHRTKVPILWCLMVVLAAIAARSQPTADVATNSAAVAVYKKMSLEQLMDLDVTSVSKHTEKLSETASAIQVVTGEQIRRSGASSIPEALRLAGNLEVAQVDSRQWAISARGFNNTTATRCWC